MSPQNDVLIHTTTGLRVLISADSCAGLKVAVFIRVGVSAAARCVTDVTVATKKIVVKYIKQSKALTVHTDGAHIFSHTHRCYWEPDTIWAQTKGDHDKKKNKEPLHDRLLHCRVPKTLRAIGFSQSHFIFGRFRENGKPVSGRF